MNYRAAVKSESCLGAQFWLNDFLFQKCGKKKWLPDPDVHTRREYKVNYKLFIVLVQRFCIGKLIFNLV